MDQNLLDVAREHPGYAYEAYEFVCEAVTFTQELHGRYSEESEDPEAEHHVSAEELCRGACLLAVKEFGLMAPIVFRQWGVKTTNDIGNIVFLLIDGGLLSKSESDKPSDFENLFEIEPHLLSQFEMTCLPPGRRRAD